MAPACKNCGWTVSGNFCAHCGQRAQDHRRSVGSLLKDAVSELFSVDGRHLRTARALLVPGRLTVAYLAGKRASYVTPVRIYLATSLLFFLTADFTAPNAADFDVLVDGQVLGERPTSDERPDIGLTTSDRSTALGRALGFQTRSEEFRSMSPQQLLDELFDNLERSLPNGLILFLPFLALALKLLYLRTGTLYYDHLIFALHFQSLLFLALVAARVANGAGLERLLSPTSTYVTAFALVITFYLALALHRVYRQSWPRTLVKAAVLGIFYVVTSLLVIASTVFVGLSRA